ncbi:MAG TPA: PQQ-binding-like beta-propeller repeat protein [Thermoplasmata archaeon]|nr:PQQ-binding-like beta-propeller repeat protein [Thermoplasmata archaeon]
MRRSLVLLVILAALLVVPVAQGRAPGHVPALAPHAGSVTPAASSPLGGTWPTFRGTDGRDGYTTSSGPSTARLAWNRILSSSVGLHLRSGPVVNGSMIVVADDLGDLYALNLTQNGSTIWETQVGPIPTTPTLADGLVVVGDSYGGLHAIRSSDGRTVWNRSLGSPILQSVLVVGATGYAVTLSGAVVAVDLRTGLTDWAANVGSAPSGAPADDGSQLYIGTDNGTLVALDLLTGSTNWTVHTAALLRVGPVVADGRILLAGFNGRVVAVSTGGVRRWNWSEAAYGEAGAFEAPPAVDDSTAYLVNDQGGVYGVWVANGTLRWNTSTPWPHYLGYNVTAAPVIAANGLYAVDALEELDRIDPATGAFLWTAPLATTVYSAPAVFSNSLIFGDDFDTLTCYSTPAGTGGYPVTGTVTDLAGDPISNATIVVHFVTTLTTAANGSYLVALSNGSYDLTAEASGYQSVTRTILVAGPTPGVDFQLRPVTLYAIGGVVEDGASLRPLADVTVRVTTSDGRVLLYTADASGRFTAYGPNGTNTISADPPGGYVGASVKVIVTGGPVTGTALLLAPLALMPAQPVWTGNLLVSLLPLAALGLGGMVAGFWGVSYARRSAGLSGAVLSRFGRVVVMRSILVVVQALALLALLFFVGGFLHALLLTPTTPCSASAGWCTNCPWSSPWCTTVAFAGGWLHFAWNIFSLNWGTAQFGRLVEPSVQFIQWWIGPSIELGVVALTISAALAYVVGLQAGWRPDRPFDVGARMLSLVGLLVPSFLVILLLLLALYTPFSQAIGDTPYGILPNQQWYDTHGGFPGWIGLGSNTGPTGFPLVDGLIHRDWSFEFVVAMKTLFQASIIALVYTAIFLRYARHAVAELSSSLPIVAARSRGVPEGTLLWRHAGREAVPLYILIFGITLPIYIGTQAVAEALFNDVGIGRVIIAEMTQVASTGFGFHSALGGTAGNLYQVTIFLLLLVLLVSSLCSDILHQYLDPRLYRSER